MLSAQVVSTRGQFCEAEQRNSTFSPRPRPQSALRPAKFGGALKKSWEVFFSTRACSVMPLVQPGDARRARGTSPVTTPRGSSPESVRHRESVSPARRSITNYLFPSDNNPVSPRMQRGDATKLINLQHQIRVRFPSPGKAGLDHALPMACKQDAQELLREAGLIHGNGVSLCSPTVSSCTHVVTPQTAGFRHIL